MDVTVAVATYGDRHWQELAETRAVPSALAQAPVIRVHGDTLHDARNTALARVGTPHVVFLDADDELAPDYIDQMRQGTADLRAPAVSYVRRGRPRSPYVPRVAGHHHACTAECVTSGDGNWLVIGTWAPTQLLRDVGGWRDWACYEDYDLWMRVLLAGATVETMTRAVYYAHVRPDSRNRGPRMDDKNAVHMAINAANLHQAAA